MENHERHIIPNFISPQMCKELGFIHKSNCTVGYRPNVFSTTLSHLIATNCPHLIIPFIPIRELVKDKVEELFGCEFELFVEFTGLISWTKGASIGWHSDDNRSYLQQRDFTAVCYLNSYGENFEGGIFHFQDGEPADYVPKAGDLVLYSADSKNIHCVDEITNGERMTLTFWFSRNNLFDEDGKLISLLIRTILNSQPALCVPLPAPSNMYWFSSDQGSDQLKGFDVRFARLFSLGYDIFSQGNNCSEMNATIDVSDVFAKPLRLVRGDKLFSKEFTNLLHALQLESCQGFQHQEPFTVNATSTLHFGWGVLVRRVDTTPQHLILRPKTFFLHKTPHIRRAVQFYYWNQSDLLQSEGVRNMGDVLILSEAQKQDVRKLRCLLLSNMQLDATIFGYSSSSRMREPHFDWDCFSASVTSWQEYNSKLHEQLLVHLPFWKENTALFSVSCPVAED